MEALIKKVVKETAKAYEARTAKELTGNSLHKESGKVNFLGSVEHNLTNILPELIEAIRNNPEILELKSTFQDPWVKNA